MPHSELAAGLQLEVHAYPLTDAVQRELTALLRTEWTRTDYDWAEAMRGDYSARLAIHSVVARQRGAALATATIHFARRHPEVAVIGNVLTLRQHRDQGLAGRVIEVALKLARDAGCRVCLLGTARNPHNVYMHHGFAWANGTVMRRTFGAADFEAEAFAPGQAAQVRPADWGDLPGVTLLAAQPLATLCLDYPRRLCSGRFIPAERCLSNFPVLWYDTAARGGQLAVLAAPNASRVFGFGTLTLPAAGSAGPATVDVVTHDQYADRLPALLDHLLADACRRQLAQVEAMVAAADGTKLAALQAAGFTVAARLSAALRLAEGTADFLRLTRLLYAAKCIGPVSRGVAERAEA